MGRYWKAIVAFFAPGATLLIAGATNGFTRTEVAVALLTCVVASAAVYAVPNRPE